MSESGTSHAGGPARRALLALLPKDDWSQAFVAELDAELERLRARGVVRRPRWWYAKQLLSPQTLLFLARVRRRARRARGVAGRRSDLGITWLDFKLGARMLVKYPGLTLVGGLAMAFGIFAGAACFEFVSQVVFPKLPFDEGERIVDIALLDDRSQETEPRLLHDFGRWQTDFSSIEDLGAARPLFPYLLIGEGRGEPIRAAAMTGSAFTMTRVRPFMGRTVVPADESPAAPDVLVIGYDIWQTRFGADPDVIGRTVLLGEVEHTVIGVMPPGFGFPINEKLWIPLRPDPASLEPLRGPGIWVFGRLAPGTTLEQARTQLRALVARARAERPDVYEHLHARVLPYGQAFLGITAEGDRLAISLINVFAALFLILVCGNVALLMFARAAAREGEIIVRTALGASRQRIVGQLFSEALVLATVAGLAGVGAAGYGLGQYTSATQGALPAFWLHTSLSPRTLVYAALLTVLAAVIAGVVPALKITSGKLDSRLRRASAGGGGIRFGGVWTAVIVVQVAATVTFPVVGWFVRRDAVNIRDQDLGFAAEEYLAFRLRLNPRASDLVPDSAVQVPLRGRYVRTVRELTERLAAEPSVAGVTMTANLPGTYHNWRRIELDKGPQAARTDLDENGPGRWVSGGRVAPNFFDVLGARALQGRTLNAGDADPEARTVVVNQPFVDHILEGRNPIGRHLRYRASSDDWDGVELGDEPGPWYRIVGVVPDLGMHNGASGQVRAVGFYHAVSLESLQASSLLIHVNGIAPAAFASRLNEIARDVEPDLALVAVQSLDQAKDQVRREYAFWIRLIVAVCGLAILLSLAGIYAVMAFTVERRTREIGVRVALGAGPGRVAATIFRRPLLQIAGGLLTGLLICAWLSGYIDGKGLWGKPLVVLLAYAALMTMVCLLACIVPMRRALRVEPHEALSAEA